MNTMHNVYTQNNDRNRGMFAIVISSYFVYIPGPLGRKLDFKVRVDELQFAQRGVQLELEVRVSYTGAWQQYISGP